ncbi:hypothetical protein L6164_031236 [Bauhinia variegata]|uniref:Uncharacterized protein n=1 Tax=Bauhinia variegata TaxID=167791 RepID=A0ACB9LEP6_BAUVA|nr:hypothetical protein L6164_031236 [Bauhinia variegata]
MVAASANDKRVTLIEKPLNWVADKVHEFLEAAVTEEHFLGLIDWMEAHRPEPSLAKIYFDGTEDGPAFVVSSGLRFPESIMDFWWDKPGFRILPFPVGWGCRLCHAPAKPRRER